MLSFIKKRLILIYLQKIIWKFLKYFHKIHRNPSTYKNNCQQKQMLKNFRIGLANLKNLKDSNKSQVSAHKSPTGKTNRDMIKKKKKTQNGQNLILKNNQLNFSVMLWKMKAKFVSKQQKKRKKNYLCKRRKNAR